MWTKHLLFALCTIFVGLSQTALANNNQHNLLNDAESGIFLMRSMAGNKSADNYTPATLLNTDVDIQVSGPIARVTVKQSFFNQGQQFAEGVYVFPLPDKSAVDDMEMRIGQRRIIGEIKEKAEAKRIYQQAKREGKRAALVEQQRPNLFTSSVANIAPGEAIEVTISYIETLKLDGHRFSLRFPMTLTPRFMPAPDSAAIHDLDMAPISNSEATKESFISRFFGGLSAISPPQVEASAIKQELRNPVNIRATIDAGQAIENLHSPYHKTVNSYDGQRHHIKLQMSQVPMDQDFVLHWDIANGDQASAAFYTENIGGRDYGLLMLMPPQQVASRTNIDREMIFIVDTSGSMGGESIRQARSSLQSALRRLSPRAHFNVIEFNSNYSQLFNQTQIASEKNIQQALNFVDHLQAGGGTEMAGPLRAALTMPGSTELESSHNTLRQLVFITDGAVGNENSLFAITHQLLGNSRLFTVGIGSAPNSYFMRKAAEFGRGSFTHIGSTSEVDKKMQQLFQKLENPVLQDIRIELPADISAEMWPARVPDLYQGEPVLVAMEFNQLPSHITAHGQGNTPWQRKITLGQSQGHSGISTLWARNKISALMDRITRGESEQTLKSEIVDISLKHKLTSRYTNFVAVDKTPARNPNTLLKTDKIANMVPKGSAAYPATATGVQLWWLMAIVLGLFATVQRRLQKSPLPEGAHCQNK